MGLSLLTGVLAQAQSPGDAKKYGSTPGNPKCHFFDGFADNADGTVTDTRYGLMWKRCAEGSTWDGKSCSVTAAEMNWSDAIKAAKESRFLGHRDWQLPSLEVFSTILGGYKDCKNNRDEKSQYAVSASLVHAVNQDDHPGWYWSSSPFEGNGNFLWVVNFGDAFMHHDYNGYRYAVRLVRQIPSAPAAFVPEFEAQYQKVMAAENAFLVRQRELEAEAFTRRPELELEEARRKALQARAEASTLLLTEGVQSLYLQAGKAQRSGGGLQISGVSFSASQLYELIVERFSSSEFAVKASDQLNAIAQLEALERLNAGNRSRDTCQADLRRRELSCESPASPPGCLAYVRQTYRCD